MPTEPDKPNIVQITASIPSWLNKWLTSSAVPWVSHINFVALCSTCILVALAVHTTHGRLMCPTGLYAFVLLSIAAAAAAGLACAFVGHRGLALAHCVTLVAVCGAVFATHWLKHLGACIAACHDIQT